MTQQANRASLRPSYDYVIVGAGAAGCVLASELSASGAQVLLIESGGTDDASTVLDPGVWFATWAERSTTACRSCRRPD